MNREILFRGKIGNDWVYGDLRQFKSDSIAIMRQGHTFPYLIDPETVGQYTGLTDKNSVKIFEGDIIKGKSGVVYAVEYSQNIAGYISRGFGVLPCPCMNVGSTKYYEVIGNIHDNPDLIGGGVSD